MLKLSVTVAQVEKNPECIELRKGVFLAYKFNFSFAEEGCVISSFSSFFKSGFNMQCAVAHFQEHRGKIL